MKKLILLASLGFILASCGSTTTSTTGSTNFTGTGFAMDIPSSWVTVGKENLPNPGNGTIALAMTSTEITSGFANNLTIIKDKLSEKISSKQYAIANYALTTQNYIEFVKTGESTVTFADKDTTNVYTFEAKYSNKTPKQTFVQSAKVCGDQVYLITFGLGLNTGSTTKYEDLIKTFACK